MHKCPKCGSQDIKGEGWVDYAFDTELCDFFVDVHNGVDYMTCNSCGHELTEEERSDFWGLV